MTRPTVAEVFEYRHAVDDRLARLLHKLGIDRPGDGSPEMAGVVELGINHEQQHQELMLTDLKHAFSCNPLLPAYRPSPACPSPKNSRPGGWSSFEGGVVEIGHAGRAFAFDNERPRHKSLLQPFELRNRLATNGEYLEFMNDGGYRRPDLWLSLGWSTLRDQQWEAPLYWIKRDGNWQEFSLGGLRRLNLDEPVCHISYFEADAFARWSGARLPTEPEWEHAASGLELKGSFVESERYHPALVDGDHTRLAQMFGEVWQWTASPYTAYPGYAPLPGTLGEYNGKFMCNQFVSARWIMCLPRQPSTSDLPQFLSAGLRGGSLAVSVWLATQKIASRVDVAELPPSSVPETLRCSSFAESRNRLAE